MFSPKGTANGSGNKYITSEEVEREIDYLCSDVLLGLIYLW